MASHSRTRLFVRRFVLIFIVTSLSLALMAWILPGISVDGWDSAILAAGTVAILNALVWPIVSRYFAVLILWTLGILGFIINGLILMLAAEIVSGFTVNNLGTAMLASLGMTFVSVAVASLLTLDDDAVWQRQTLRRLVRRIDDVNHTDVPGIIFMQIDGLSETVLRRALSEGYMPTLANWVRSGTHHIKSWECDLSSQTGASQAGILHGNNTDMPAFRWYDKDSARVFTSNRPRDAAEIEARQSDGHGLLADGGVSRSNVFSGDSKDSMLTFSTVLDHDRHSRNSAAYFFSDPYALGRLLSLMFADIGREIADYRRTKKRDIQPQQKRGGIYPLLRAGTTVALRDLTVYTLMGDIYSGVPAAYVDFVGYDEVAHHSGISAATALETLYRLDQQLVRIERAAKEGPRPYHLVVLSDHGQTQGSTFLQRYDVSLSDLVSSLIDAEARVDSPEMPTEGWGNLNGALSDAINDEDSRVAGMVRLLVRRRTVEGEVELGTPKPSDDVDMGDDEAVVLASGNLGLISFPQFPGRATLEQLALRYPNLISGLASHPGIGFVLVRSETYGALVVGRHGIRYLSDDRVEGEDPLTTFGPRAADHLRRTDAFSNTPDLLVNSFYDPESDEGAAFEELIGFHGGLGGKQAEPFVLCPSSFPVPDDEIVGAASIHHLFKGWMTNAASDTALAPWEPVPEPDVDVRLPGVAVPDHTADDGSPP